MYCHVKNTCVRLNKQNEAVERYMQIANVLLSRAFLIRTMVALVGVCVRRSDQ